MKRLFVAIPISEELQKGILEWEKYFNHLPVRWLSGKNLHITLVPPWYEDNAEEVAEKLKTIKGEFGSFDVAFKRVNFGPDPKNPRLIWAENTMPQKILDLKDKVEQALMIEGENRFKFHLTVARFRPETFTSFPIKKLDEVIFWPDKIKSIVLMESHLSPAGADYEILEEIKFGV